MPAGFESEGKALMCSLSRSRVTQFYADFTRDFRANEKFHLSPAFHSAVQCRNTVNQLQFKPSKIS